MSWGFVHVGNAKKIAEQVNKEKWFPIELRQAFTDMAEKIPDEKILILESSGHQHIVNQNDQVVSDDSKETKIVYGSGTLSWKIVNKVE
jgi:hypothetical protein